MLLTFILIIISIPSPAHSFTPGLKPSFSANPSRRSLPSVLQDWLHGFPGLFTNTSEHIRFYFLVFLFSTFQLSVPCGRLNWHVLALELTLKYHLVLYRIQQTAGIYPWLDRLLFYLLATRQWYVCKNTNHTTSFTMPIQTLCSAGAKLLLLVGHQGCEWGTWREREHEPQGLGRSPQPGPQAEQI